VSRDEPERCTTPSTSPLRGPPTVPQGDPSAGISPQGKPQPSPGFLVLAGLGVSLAVCVAGGVGLGIYLDDVTHRSPLFTLLGLALGVVIAVAVAYVQIKKFL
jgi:hypothetical protein